MTIMTIMTIIIIIITVTVMIVIVIIIVPVWYFAHDAHKPRFLTNCISLVHDTCYSSKYGKMSMQAAEAC